MRFKPIVKAGTMGIGVLLTVIALLLIYIFVLWPVSEFLTNVLLIAVVLMQLLTVIVLIHIHDVLTGEWKRER